MMVGRSHHSNQHYFSSGYSEAFKQPSPSPPGANFTPYRLPVTPASRSATSASASSGARKRPRYYESPLPSYEHSTTTTQHQHQHHHPHQYRQQHHEIPPLMSANRTPPRMVRSPPQRPQLRPSMNSYYSGPSAYFPPPFNSSPSPNRPASSSLYNNSRSQTPRQQHHHVPPSVQSTSTLEPWTAEVPQPFAGVPPVAGPSSEFDLFNEELLSDDEGVDIPPQPFMTQPKRESF